MRLIDADALRTIQNINKANFNRIETIQKWIDEQPTIELKTGKWIGQTPFVDTEECSCCGYNIVSNEMETPYCPNCGADMRIIGTGEQNG